MSELRAFSETALTTRDLLEGLALADNMGDVNDYLPWIADAFGEARPEWDDLKRRFVFPWERTDD